MIAPVLASVETVAATTPTTWVAAAVAAGSLVGLSLGLTGGGGAIFAVPLLVYWIGVDPRTAVSISLVTVAATALVAFATMDVFRAVGTSLFVTTLVGAAAVAAQVAAGRGVPLDIAGSFVGGGVPALFVGSWIGRRISGPTLARVFAVAIVLVAACIISKSLAGI